MVAGERPRLRPDDKWGRTFSRRLDGGQQAVDRHPRDKLGARELGVAGHPRVGCGNWCFRNHEAMQRAGTYGGVENRPPRPSPTPWNKDEGSAAFRFSAPVTTTCCGWTQLVHLPNIGGLLTYLQTRATTPATLRIMPHADIHNSRLNAATTSRCLTVEPWDAKSAAALAMYSNC